MPGGWNLKERMAEQTAVREKNPADFCKIFLSHII
jgi:hypothetical protein